MIVYRAAWVCPMDQPPIEHGWVAVSDGLIVALGSGDGPLDDRDSPRLRDLGAVAVMPGLVNAHTHFELSWLRGRVPPTSSFLGWITQLLALRRKPENPDDPDVQSAALGAAREALASGTVAVGDVSNSLASAAPIAESGLAGLIFHELLGFAERDAGLVERSAASRQRAASLGTPVSVAPHAPYSTSPELFRAIHSAVSASSIPISAVHVGESREEMEMLASGTGAWPSMLKTVGAWRDDWEVPCCGPIEYLDRLGVLDARMLVVHGVQLSDAELSRLAALGATLVTCPRSNQWVGVGVPPIDRFYRSGVAVAVGTDSLASVEDLNLFSELKAMRWLAPAVPARALLRSATIVGARALGLDTELGTITPGKRARLITIELPVSVDDIEEYLVSGIDSSQVEPVQAEP